MTIQLIGVRKICTGHRIVKTDAHALRVSQFQVLHHAAGQISVGSIDARIQNCDGDPAATDGQPMIGARQVVGAPDAIDTGDAAGGRIKVPLKSAIAID